MLGEPIADVAELIRVARQIDAVAQRRRGFGAGGDDGQVEDGERNHRPYLVHGIRPTKGFGTQIRRAGEAERRPSKRAKLGQDTGDNPCFDSAHTWVPRPISRRRTQIYPNFYWY